MDGTIIYRCFSSVCTEPHIEALYLSDLQPTEASSNRFHAPLAVSSVFKCVFPEPTVDSYEASVQMENEFYLIFILSLRLIESRSVLPSGRRMQGAQEMIADKLEAI